MPRTQISKSEIRGIIVPLVTPFKGKYGVDLDLSVLTRLSNYLIEKGVHGLMPLGTSGEFGLVDKHERRLVVETVVKAASRRVPVIAGVSSSGTDNAIKLAQDSATAGADAMISTGPYYYRTSPEGLLLHFQSLLDAVDLPLMVYNIPGWAGYNIPAEVVKTLSDRNRGRVLGVKFTTNDLGEFLIYLRLLKHEMSIMIGSDALAFSALELGAAGAVLGSANALPEETVHIYESYMRENFEGARKAQERIDPFTETMTLGTYPSALKVAMRMIGIDCGPVRRPLLPLSQDETKSVEASIAWKINKKRKPTD
ncbi:MAG: dihydrodipicolinate synthase family protein [Nitrososphaerales archaeon]